MQQVEELGHLNRAVKQPFVHVDVDDVRASLDLLPGDGDRFVRFLLLDQPGELARAGDVRPLADHHEVGVGAEFDQLPAGVRRVPRSTDVLARPGVLSRLREMADELRRGAAAAADDVHPAVGRERADRLREVDRVRLEAAETVRHAGVGIAADVAAGAFVDDLDKGPDLRRSERAVEPHAEHREMLNRGEKGFQRLPRERAAPLEDRAGDHHRHFDRPLVEDLADREQAGLHIERVERRLRQQQVDAAVEQSANLLGVRGDHLIEIDGAMPRLIRIEGKLHLCRPNRPGDEPRLVGGLLGELHRRPLGQLRPGAVDLPHTLPQPELLQRDGVGVEGVGLDDVRSGFEVLPVDRLDNVGPRQAEDIGGVLEVDPVVAKPFAPVVRLGRLEAVNERPHRPIQQQDATGDEVVKLFGR